MLQWEGIDRKRLISGWFGETDVSPNSSLLDEIKSRSGYSGMSWVPEFI